MPIYEYRNDDGETREITAPMDTPPPEVVTIFDDGSWFDLEKPMKFADQDPRLDELRSKTNAQRIFRRVYGSGLGIQTPNYACNADKSGLPISKASPRIKGGKLAKIGNHTVREHADGTVTNIHGQPIVDSNHRAKEIAKKTGMEID